VVVATAVVEKSRSPAMRDLSPKPGDLEPIETASVDELRGLQVDRLRWTVRHAYDNVAHYRASFDVAGVHPDDVKSLEDLALLPFTAKADLRENYPFVAQVAGSVGEHRFDVAAVLAAGNGVVPGPPLVRRQLQCR
jgi:phenylacetate-coenzyme A ligase PaaK-like adenylate-forming protein